MYQIQESTCFNTVIVNSFRVLTSYENLLKLETLRNLQEAYKCDPAYKVVHFSDIASMTLWLRTGNHQWCRPRRAASA